MLFGQIGSVGMTKMFLLSEEGSPEKISYVSAMMVVLTDKLTF